MFRGNLVRKSAVLCALMMTCAAGCAVEAEEVDQQEDHFTNMPNLDFPEDSEWAKGRIGKGCGIRFTSERVVGVISDTDGFAYGEQEYGAGVLYEAELDGEVIAAAWARSTTVWSTVECVFY